MGSTKNVDMSATDTDVKIVEAPTETAAEETKTTAPKKAKPRSAKYQKVRAQVDKTRLYDPFSAVELVKRLSYSNFTGTITAHGVVKETGTKADITFPHSTGKTVTVAVADEALLKKIEAGDIEFDVLIATPDMMPKLAKHARVLGPKGLMPNPKNGTIVDDPAKAKKAFEAGKITVKTEKKAPLIHVTVGNTEMETKAIVENIQTLTKAFKGKLLKLSLAASMSPGVKVDFSA